MVRYRQMMMMKLKWRIDSENLDVGVKNVECSNIEKEAIDDEQVKNVDGLDMNK